MQRALIAATDVPLGVARSVHEVAEILQSVAREGNPHVRSDAALGALLAEAALRGCSMCAAMPRCSRTESWPCPT